MECTSRGIFFVREAVFKGIRAAGFMHPRGISMVSRLRCGVGIGIGAVFDCFFGEDAKLRIFFFFYLFLNILYSMNNL